MKYSSRKKKAKAANECRDLLIGSIRMYLLPALAKLGFEVAPLSGRGPIDREVVLSLPLGRLRRARDGRVDLIEVDFAKHRRAAFRILAGVAPKGGLMTLTGHWAAEDVYVGWLDEYFVMYASPKWRVSFSVWHWPYRSPRQGDFEKLALRVAGFVPELDLALCEGRVGLHMRRVVIPRPVLQRSESMAGTE